MKLHTFRYLVAALLGAVAAPALAALNVFACEPEWGALTRELAADKARVYDATSAFQDVHRVQARPSLIAAMRRAELAVCTGAELEAAWLPVLLAESGNPRVRPGQPGYFEAARYVAMKEVPQRLDRALGDQHAAGNPHIQTDPHNIAAVAAALARRLKELDPDNAALYDGRHRDFSARWQAAVKRWEQAAAPLKGTGVVVHHRAFVYLNHWLGLKQTGELEPKPGVEPTSGHLAVLLENQKRDPARMVVRTPYNSARASEWLAREAGIPQVVLPYTVGGSERAKDLFGLFDDTVERLLAAAREPGR